MSMEEWPDDHLDELFRKSAEEHDVPFNAADWTDMNRRLAEHDRQQGYVRLLRWSGAALLLLLLGSLTWFIYEGKRQTTPLALMGSKAPAGAPAVVKNQPTEKRVPVRPAGPPAQATTSAAMKATPVPPTTETASVSVIPKVKTANQLAVNNVPVPAAAHVSVGSLVNTDRFTHTYLRRLPKKSFRQPKVRAVPHSSGQETDPLAVRYVAGSGVDTVAVNRLIRPADAAESGRITDLTEGITRLSEPKIVAEQSQWLPELTLVNSQSGVVQQVRSLPEPTLATNVPAVRVARPLVGPSLHRLSVLLFASPDLSAIGLKNFEKPGSNAGLSIQYQLTDRLSVHTGAMFSTKRYQTYSDDYVWPSSWVWKVWPNEIMGTCRMIDVPVNIRYDWLLRPRPNGMGPARWFASTGLTSYFIQRETYVYKYANPNDPNIQGRGWDNQRAGRPGGSFGFSNLNLSVGYERPITRRLSWQIEPFMKVPLQQVGFFRVKLLSTGAFAGLRYRL